MTWDDEVDLVCIGRGAAALASAVVATDAGLDALVTTAHAACGEPSADEPGYPARGWLGVSVPDQETNRYFAAITDDPAPAGRAPDCTVAVRTVPAQHVAERGRRIEPFIGSQSQDWAAICRDSAVGFVRSRVAGVDTPSIRVSDTESLDIVVVGAVEPADCDAEFAVDRWLATQLRRRDIRVWADSPVQRLVFGSDGDVVGAVFVTADGPVAVSARCGVAVAVDGAAPHPVDLGATAWGAVQVGLVSYRASRFGRVELLVGEPVPPTPASSVWRRRPSDSAADD